MRTLLYHLFNIGNKRQLGKNKSKTRKTKKREKKHKKKLLQLEGRNKTWLFRDVLFIYIKNPEEYIFEMIKLIYTIRMYGTEVIGHNSICSSINYYKFKKQIAVYKSMAMECPYLCEISMLETIKYYRGISLVVQWFGLVASRSREWAFDPWSLNQDTTCWTVWHK